MWDCFNRSGFYIRKCKSLYGPADAVNRPEYEDEMSQDDTTLWTVIFSVGCHYFKSSRSSNAFRPSSVEMMACGLFGGKLLSEPILVNSLLASWDQIPVRLSQNVTICMQEIEFQNIVWKKTATLFRLNVSKHKLQQETYSQLTSYSQTFDQKYYDKCHNP